MKKFRKPWTPAWLMPAILLLIAGCSHKVTATSSETHVATHDTVAALSASRDTIIMRDSVTAFISGDTVYVRSTSVRERLRTRTDTLLRILRDTVTVTRETDRASSTMKASDRFPATSAIILAAVSLLLLFLPRIIRKQKP